MDKNSKDTNPKDAIGCTKAPWSTIPTQVLGEVGVAMLEGALKYGRHNYRVSGVRASVYFDALFRHLAAWWEGEDIDPDSGLSHITKAIAGLMVLRDSMLQGNWVDDRPPRAENQAWIKELNAKVRELLEKYPNPVPAYTNRSVLAKAPEAIQGSRRLPADVRVDASGNKQLPSKEELKHLIEETKVELRKVLGDQVKKRPGHCLGEACTEGSYCSCDCEGCCP